jgi:outer membrane autotransporter protein
MLVPLAVQAQTAPPPLPPATQSSTEPAPQAAAAPALRFWDGGDPARHRNGVADGGSGIWSTAAPNWTDAGGTTNGPMQPVPAAVQFGGIGGTVTMDDSGGVPAVSAMRFGVDGYRLTGGELRLDGGRFTLVEVGAGMTTRIDSPLVGDGGLLYAAPGTLILSGENRYAGGTRVDFGTLIGDTRSIRGALENGGTTVFDQAFDDRFEGDMTSLASVWGLMVKRGAGTLTLGGGNLLDWRVEQGGLVAKAAGFGGNIEIAEGARTVLSSGDTAGARSTYYYQLSGAGRFEAAGEGLLVLAGNSSGFTGHSEVRGTAMRIEGALGGTLHVGADGQLSGTGRAGDVSVGAGGRLIGTAGETLKLTGLVLQPGAIIDATLSDIGMPSLFSIEGDLTLDGTINIAGTRPIGAGVYRIIGFSGALQNNGLSIGTLPSGQERSLISIRTTSAWGVDLVSEVGGSPMQFWDGSDPTRFGNGMIDGGPGVWRRDLAGWTDRYGKAKRTSVGTGFSVFEGRPGQVVIDAGNAGAIQTGGMQFAVTGYTLSGSGLRLAGADDRTVFRVGDGSEWGSTMTAEIAAPISGYTRLVKNDAGTLILSGANSYTGPTEVEGGTLIGNTASIRNTLLNAGTVVFDQRTNGTFANMIVGLRGSSGVMVKRGSGVLTLAKESRLDWTVEEGRLVVQADQYRSRFTTLLGGGELELKVSNDLRLDTTFLGDGRLTKTGTGRLVLDAHSPFTGTTRVAAGELALHGNLGGHVVVESGATLSGDRTVGSLLITRGGTLSPSSGFVQHDTALLRVSGDLTFEPGGRFEVDVSGASSDFVRVEGVAHLAGSVYHIGKQGDYAPSSSYLILIARGGIEGRFDGIESAFAFLTPRLDYTARSVWMTLDRNDVQFSAVATSDNQQAVAIALQTLAIGDPLYDAVIDADVEGARFAFADIAGDLHASLRIALVEDSRLPRTVALDRLRTPAGDPGVSMWGEAIGAWGHYGSDGNAARLERSAAGGLAGVEAQVPGGDVRLGVFGGYHRADLRGAGTADIDSYHSGLYAGATLGGLAMRGGVALGWHDVATRRRLDGQLAGEVRARYGATTAQAFGELGWRLELGRTTLEPFAAIAHVALDVGQGQERGDAAALALGQDDMATNYATVGLRGETGLPVGGGTLSLRGSAGWQHVFGDRVPGVAMRVDGAPFESVGLPIAEDSFVGDLGVTAKLGERLGLELGYRAAVSRRNLDHGASAALTFRF